ncbi:MAG TPA: type II toxin-antitoxin system PemK/MazF family toxin [Acetobacteraceae bacterium]|nr:type II toxin-antitoxin system PemK/MazF family toxin [Acetobacteraceae bacterium]
MRRGELWAVSGGVYASKPRPALILQSDRFGGTASVTIIPCTTDPTNAPLFRLDLAPDGDNGLRSRCKLMVDKITTIPRSNVGRQIGRLSDDDMVRVVRAMVVFIEIA